MVFIAPIDALNSIDSKLTSPLPTTIGNFPVIQAVSVSSLPLPSGASTAVGQGTGNSSLASIDAKLTTLINTPAVNPFTTASFTRPTVTNVSTQLLAANPSRKYAYIFNQGGTVMWINFGVPAVANQGWQLAANTGFYEIDAAHLWLGVVNAVKASGSAQLEVFEGT